jgi:hypothetical protein
MDITGLKNIRLIDLQDIFKLNNLSIKEAMPKMREFRDRHGLDDKTTLCAFAIAKRIFGEGE